MFWAAGIRLKAFKLRYIMRIGTKLIFYILVALLGTTAFLPLLDVNLLIHRMSITDEPVGTHFLAIRSATFASLAFFIINFLRHKRPLFFCCTDAGLLQFSSLFWSSIDDSTCSSQLRHGLFYFWLPRYPYFCIEKIKRRLA